MDAEREYETEDAAPKRESEMSQAFQVLDRENDLLGKVTEQLSKNLAGVLRQEEDADPENRPAIAELDRREFNTTRASQISTQAQRVKSARLRLEKILSKLEV
jgi:hypothetical protein